MRIVQFNLTPNYHEIYAKKIPLILATRQWEQNKKESFTNDIDTNMVNELNLV